MTRLTKKYPSGAWGIDGSIDEAVLKLAAYEESGYISERALYVRDGTGTKGTPASTTMGRKFSSFGRMTLWSK